MKYPALTTWLVVCCCSFSSFGQTAARKFQPIIFDDWWNIDYVKNGCGTAKDGNLSGKPCARTPEDTVREFEDEVEVAFASESVCHGLELLHLTPEMVHTAVKNPAAPATGKMLPAANPHWSLILDLDGHKHNQAGQGWTLVDSSAKPLSGTITTPKDLVLHVCKIAKGVGGVTK